MKSPILNSEQLLAKLRKAQGKRSLREFSASIGISVGNLHDVLNGRRRPGAAILDYMGLGERTTSVTVYVYKKVLDKSAGKRISVKHVDARTVRATDATDAERQDS